MEGKARLYAVRQRRQTCARVLSVLYTPTYRSISERIVCCWGGDIDSPYCFSFYIL